VFVIPSKYVRSGRNLVSRSTSRWLASFRNPPWQSVRFRAICLTQSPSGLAVTPAISTRRVLRRMATRMYNVVSPSLVHTSTVVKSMAAIDSQWALRNVFQVVVPFRVGAGSMPFARRIFPTVVSEISWLRLASAP
jgi:hypothetical protein